MIRVWWARRGTTALRHRRVVMSSWVAPRHVDSFSRLPWDSYRTGAIELKSTHVAVHVAGAARIMRR